MIQTKALYNLLRLNASENQSLEVDSWALEDFRILSVEELFNRLSSLNIQLDQTSFNNYSNECDSPEELLELLLDEKKDSSESDHIYLLLFELWRRLLPERPSISVFCDELDRIMEEYINDVKESDEPVQDGLANLLEILQEHVDLGMSPKEAFLSLSDYTANDIECFLFDYISDLLDQKNLPYVQQLLEDFEPYIQDPSQFEFLAARLFSFTDIGETNRRIKEILAKRLEPELLFDILHLLVSTGDHRLFQEAIIKILPEIHLEEEFQEAIDLAADYYGRLDFEEKEEALLQLKIERKSAPSDLDPQDPAINKFKELVFSQTNELKA